MIDDEGERNRDREIERERERERDRVIKQQGCIHSTQQSEMDRHAHIYLTSKKQLHTKDIKKQEGKKRNRKIGLSEVPQGKRGGRLRGGR